MIKMYLITYKENGFIEGFVNLKGDFDKWLSQHNRDRKTLGAKIEYKDEFEIKEINRL